MLSYGKVILDIQTRTVTYDGRTVKLNPKEYSLLELFLSYPRHVLSYDAIIDRVWSGESVPTQSCIRTHIKRLRKAFNAVDYPEEVVENVRGLGYRLKLLNEAEMQIIRPPFSVLKRFFKARAIEYLVLDDRSSVCYLSPGAIRYSDYPSEVRKGGPVWDGFPEFVGLESIFGEIIAGSLEAFELKGIGRGQSPQRPDYINFYAIADSESQPVRLFVFFEDCSSYMHSRQRLVQYANETVLLVERFQEG